jgi:hypothetical protein
MKHIPTPAHANSMYCRCGNFLGNTSVHTQTLTLGWPAAQARVWGSLATMHNHARVRRTYALRTGLDLSLITPSGVPYGWVGPNPPNPFSGAPLLPCTCGAPISPLPCLGHDDAPFMSWQVAADKGYC